MTMIGPILQFAIPSDSYGKPMAEDGPILMHAIRFNLYDWDSGDDPFYALVVIPSHEVVIRREGRMVKIYQRKIEEEAYKPPSQAILAAAGFQRGPGGER